MKIIPQANPHGFCSRCRKSVLPGAPLALIRHKPHCLTCAGLRDAEIAAKRAA